MGIGAISITTPGSVTEPSSLTVAEGSALSEVFRHYGPSDVIPLPSLRAVLFCNGLDFQYHAIDLAQYLNGPLAPPTAPTAASTAARASTTLTISGVPGDGTTVQIGKPGVTFNGYITWKTTLDPTAAYDQVKTGGSIANAISNIYAFINGTGTQGTEFYSGRMGGLGYPTPSWDTENDVSASTLNTGAGTCVISAVSYGTAGNSYNSNAGAGSNCAFTSTVFTGGTAGTGTALGAGNYVYANARYRAGDFAQTAISPTTEVGNLGNANITLSSFTNANAREGTLYDRIFRSTVNGGSELYKVEDTTSDPETDSSSDETITGDFALLYDARNYRPYPAGYPARFSAMTLHKGVVFATGAVLSNPDVRGTTASVTVGSMSVTFSATTRFKDTIIGNEFVVASTTDAYVITDFVESTKVATLNRAYVGATNATASYTLKDARDSTEIYWGVAGLYNSWPAGNSLKGVNTTDTEGCTGIKSAWDRLAVFTRTGVWNVWGDPSSGMRVTQAADGMGAYNNRSVVSVEGRLYWLGPDGIFAWNGEGIPESLSKPSIAATSGKPRGIHRTIQRINTSQGALILASYNPTNKLIRWFVPLDGAPWNTHAIVYDTQTGAFALDSCVSVTAAANFETAEGEFVTVVGDAHGRLWQLDTGTSDGAYGFDPVVTPASYAAGTRTVTFSGTPLPTGLSGVPFLQVTSTGDVYTHIVASNTTSTVIPVSEPTSAFASTDKLIFGGIEWRLKSCLYDFGRPDLTKNISSLTVSYVPQSLGQLWCAAGADTATPSVFLLRSSGAADVALLANTDGEHLFWLRKSHGRRVVYELLALCPGFDVEVLSAVPNHTMADTSGG